MRQRIECIECQEKGPFVAGQAFTEYTCTICGKKKVWHNTAVPKVCDECAQKFGLCQTCGKKIKD